MLNRAEFGCRGYLREDFRFFHLRDSLAQEMEFHYHDFDKIVFQLGGRVVYNIEGKRYFLKPYDILLVGRNLIHKPIIDPGEPYERMVLWLSGDYLASRGRGCELRTCFELTERRGVHLFRPRGEERTRYRERFGRIAAAVEDGGFGAALMADTCVLQLLLALNRDVLRAPAEEEEGAYRFDPKMEEVTRYISEHLSEELSIDALAGVFYLSRYYLMHRFKEVYGITVHQYVRQKRLLRAAEAIRQGVPVLKAAQEAGFNDYSAFLRAFQAAYGKSPREWK